MQTSRSGRSPLLAGPRCHILRRPGVLCPLLAILTTALTLAALPSQAAAPRERILFDAGWRFHRGDLPYTAPGAPVTGWEWKPAQTNGALRPAYDPTLNQGSEGWKPAAIGQDVFSGQPGFAWFRAILPAARGRDLQLHFESVDDNGVIYVNGREVFDHQGWNDPFDAPLDSAWNPAGTNTVLVLVENTNGPGGIAGPVTLEWDTSSVAGGAAGPNYDDRSWQPVHLPHDFIIDGAFTPTAEASHGFLPKMVGWYRKTFRLPASDRSKRLWLEFDGVYRNSTVWLNGRRVGTQPSGYISFYYDISHFAHYGGPNVLAVRVDPTADEGWWYEGGGIYRHVYLTKLAPLHVDHWGVAITSLVSHGNEGADTSADVTIRTQLANDGADLASCRLVSTILDPRGQIAGSASAHWTIPSAGHPIALQSVHLLEPRLWSLEAPWLYHLRTDLVQNGRVIDETITPFGVRTVHFDPNKGLFLNGIPVKMQGTCNHQDFAGIGIALPDRVHLYKIQKLKEMGSNAYRCSHHPYAPELLNDCDRLGMLVMDENRHLGDSPQVLGEVASMVQRDRNHPSVIMWSMCNEEGRQGTPEGARLFSAMKDVVHRYDTTRPVTCAMNGGFGKGISLVEDLQGFNYNEGAYDSFHAAFPNQPCYASETASTVTDRGIYADDPAKGYVTSYHLTEGSWIPVADRVWMAGSFAWTGFDYRGEPTPYGWPCVNSHFGIMDTCGFPKDNYFYYRAVWTAAPMVHLMPHWNWPGKEGQPIRVIAFSNCDRVELFLNGKSLGSKSAPRDSHLEWQVPYSPGRLEAVGYKGGKIAARDVVETTGAPAKILLSPANTQILSDSEDVAIVPVSILDSRGRVIPTASSEVVFRVQGPGRVDGVGNGNPSSHEPDKASQRRAFNGRCLVIVQSTGRPGTIRLTASSPGLQTATVVIRALPRRLTRQP